MRPPLQRLARNRLQRRVNPRGSEAHEDPPGQDPADQTRPGAFDKLDLDPETQSAFADFISKTPAAGFIAGTCVPIDGGMGVS